MSQPSSMPSLNSMNSSHAGKVGTVAVLLSKLVTTPVDEMLCRLIIQTPDTFSYHDWYDVEPAV